MKRMLEVVADLGGRELADVGELRSDEIGVTAEAPGRKILLAFPSLFAAMNFRERGLPMLRLDYPADWLVTVGIVKPEPEKVGEASA